MKPSILWHSIKTVAVGLTRKSNKRNKKLLSRRYPTRQTLFSSHRSNWGRWWPWALRKSPVTMKRRIMQLCWSTLLIRQPLNFRRVVRVALSHHACLSCHKSSKRMYKVMGWCRSQSSMLQAILALRMQMWGLSWLILTTLRPVDRKPISKRLRQPINTPPRSRLWQAKSTYWSISREGTSNLWRIHPRS